MCVVYERSVEIFEVISFSSSSFQDLVNKISGGSEVWIGLTDSDEDTWKWVDGSISTLTSG